MYNYKGLKFRAENLSFTKRDSNMKFQELLACLLFKMKELKLNIKELDRDREGQQYQQYCVFVRDN